MKPSSSKYPMPCSYYKEKNNECSLLAKLKEAQIERIRANDANDAKSEFLANMSHEIRNPAGVMINIANILAIGSNFSTKQRDLIRILQLSSESLINLINDFLDITKIEARHINLEKIPFSLFQTVQEVAHMMSASARSKGLKFTTDCESVRDQIFLGDPMRLRQMLLNLCSNAIKFTEKGDISILVISEASSIKEIKQIRISVRDTGIGISPEYQERIFEKFSQPDATIGRKYGGTGLGLNITKKLAEAMDGTISLKSFLGKGSTFTLCLPLPLKAAL
ncbi:MAG: ATP-binding protein [Alphaproteobacteria bacterium]|nr:ATP-binding protein [Alphaproteobacteria bacterium]